MSLSLDILIYASVLNSSDEILESEVNPSIKPNNLTIQIAYNYRV